MFDSLFGGENGSVLNFVGALILVIALILLVAWLFRRFVSRADLHFGPRTGQRRLAVVEASGIDAQRRLILVRRDDVEHLLLISNSGDIVVESNIHKEKETGKAPAPRPAPSPQAAAPQPQPHQPPRPVSPQAPHAQPRPQMPLQVANPPINQPPLGQSGQPQRPRFTRPEETQSPQRPLSPPPAPAPTQGMGERPTSWPRPPAPDRGELGPDGQ